jgi:hypothetical protein
MVDVFDEVDQALQREKLVAWLDKYGKILATCIVLIVAGTAANVWWGHHNKAVLETQTAELLNVLMPQSIDNKDLSDDQAIAALKNLQAQGKSQLDVLASLQLASLYESKGDNTNALATLQPLLKRRYTERVLQDLAIVQYVRLQLAEKKPSDSADQLLSYLNGLDGAKRPFRHTARELQGLILLQQGKKASAQKLFADLSEDMQAPQSLRTRAQSYLVASRSTSQKTQ